MQAVKFPSFNKYKSQKVNWLHDKFDGHLAVIIKADVLTGVFTKNGNNVSDKCSQVCRRIRRYSQSCTTQTSSQQTCLQC